MNFFLFARPFFASQVCASSTVVKCYVTLCMSYFLPLDESIAESIAERTVSAYRATVISSPLPRFACQVPFNLPFLNSYLTMILILHKAQSMIKNCVWQKACIVDLPQRSAQTKSSTYIARLVSCSSPSLGESKVASWNGYIVNGRPYFGSYLFFFFGRLTAV